MINPQASPDAPRRIRVSAVITTYRREFRMLAQAVESALAQTYSPMEVIVVSDNAPGDEFATAVAEGLAAYPSVRLIQLPRNSGANVARNAGIRAARGEFIAFLDDDDLWLPRKTESQVKLFSDPRVGLVYCRGYLFQGEDIDARAEYFNSLNGGFHTTAAFDELLRRDVIGSTSQALVRRECFDVCGYFDETLPARQDYDRWLAITRVYKAAGVDEPLFMHRQHARQITKSDEIALKANHMVFLKYREYYKKDRLASMVYYYRRAYLLNQLKRRGAFLLTALRSFCCSPVGFVRMYRSYREGEAR